MSNSLEATRALVKTLDNAQLEAAVRAQIDTSQKVVSGAMRLDEPQLERLLAVRKIYNRELKARVQAKLDAGVGLGTPERADIERRMARLGQ